VTTASIISNRGNLERVHMRMLGIAIPDFGAPRYFSRAKEAVLFFGLN